MAHLKWRILNISFRILHICEFVRFLDVWRIIGSFTSSQGHVPVFRGRVSIRCVLPPNPSMGHYGFLALVFACYVTLAVSQPAQVTFEDCTSAATRSASNYDSNARINVSSVFAQIAYPNGQKTLRIRAIGETAEAVEPSEIDAKGVRIFCT